MSLRRFQKILRTIGSNPARRLTAADVRSVAHQLDHTDIGDIIDRLDELSREKDELPEWDGDSQDDVATAQETLTFLLVHLARHNHQELANCRTGRHSLTQRYLSIALQELKPQNSSD